jgi:hypothetical protein
MLLLVLLKKISKKCEKKWKGSERRLRLGVERTLLVWLISFLPTSLVLPLFYLRGTSTPLLPNTNG